MDAGSDMDLQSVGDKTPLMDAEVKDTKGSPKYASDNADIKLEATEDVAGSPIPSMMVTTMSEQNEQAGSSTKIEGGEEATIKQEGEETAVKVESNAELPLTDVKIEENTAPVAQRKQFWEAKSTSAPPVSKPRPTKAATSTQR